jgi:hypothetical protein
MDDLAQMFHRRGKIGSVGDIGINRRRFPIGRYQPKPVTSMVP